MGGYERRSEVFVKIQKKNSVWRAGGGGIRLDELEVFVGGEGGGEQRIEVCVKIQKKIGGGGLGGGGGSGWWGVRVDVNLKFHHIIYSLYSISCLKFLASNTYSAFLDIAFAISKISKKGQ